MSIFPLTATPEQVERVRQGETVDLVPARDGYRVVLREVEGEVVAEYVPACDADHCTVEERAVIDAALEWERTGGAGGTAELEKPLFDALDTLLAAREKTNDS